MFFITANIGFGDIRAYPPGLSIRAGLSPARILLYMVKTYRRGDTPALIEERMGLDPGG